MPEAFAENRALEIIKPARGKNAETYDIDIRTTFLRNEKGVLHTREFMVNNLKIHEQLNVLKERAKKGDETAMLLLLSAAWHVLPQNEVRTIIEMAHPNKGENPIIYYYLGLFHTVGVGCTYDPDIAVKLFYIAYKRGCQRAGIEFFDRVCLCPDTDYKEVLDDWRALWKGKADDPDFAARNAWAEICGLGMPRNEHKGWKELKASAARGSKFSKMQLGLRFAEIGDHATAISFLREALSFDLYVETHIYLANVLRCDKADITEEIELLYYEAARKLNHGGLKQLAEISEKRGDLKESVKLYMYAAGMIFKTIGVSEGNKSKEEKSEQKNKSANSFYEGKDALEIEGENLAAKIEDLIEKGALKNDFDSNLKILKAGMEDFIKRSYYLNERLEKLRLERFKKASEAKRGAPKRSSILPVEKKP
jgi:TPR repeat protein